MISKFIGGVLLVIGTCIGAGMLALPIVTSAGGFINSSLLMIFIWLLTVTNAFLFLEVNLWLPEDTNLITMSQKTLGNSGKIISWITYLLLLYSIICAYIAGGGDVLQEYLVKFNIILPYWCNIFIFTFIFGFIVYKGIKSVDLINRGLMSIKFITLIILMFLILPHLNPINLKTGQNKYLLSSAMILVTSFGYSMIIPSLRSYFKSDVKKLKLIIIIGSIVPLLCYLIWDLSVQGIVPSLGVKGLVSISSAENPISHLVEELYYYSQNDFVLTFSGIFTSICILTSFLGVSLCLSDFLADGLHLTKKGKNNLYIYGLTFLPPVIIILLFPGAFITCLKYAGIFCVFLLLLLPALMTFSGRYIKKISNKNDYRVFGGKIPIILNIMLSSFLFFYGIYSSI